MSISQKYYIQGGRREGRGGGKKGSPGGRGKNTKLSPAEDLRRAAEEEKYESYVLYRGIEYGSWEECVEIVEPEVLNTKLFFLILILRKKTYLVLAIVLSRLISKKKKKPIILAKMLKLLLH